jgi:hypothetical protein
MAWRKWFVRSVVFSVVACCALAGYAYQQWTNPAAVREQVLAKLKVLFPGADVAVDAARLTLMGHIQLTEARLTRHGDPDQIDAIQVPSAHVYHDKEKLFDGELSLRKVVLFKPRIRLYRDKDGNWNLHGLIGKQRLDRTIPTLVIHQGTLLFEDRTTDGNISSLEVTDVNGNLINDPLATLKFDATAQSPLVGKVALVGTFQRATGELALSFKTTDTPLGAKLLQRIAPFCPHNALQDLEVDGHADFEVALHRHPGKTPSLHYEAACAVRNTNVKHPLLPTPLEGLETKARIIDGVVTVEHLQARAEWARIKGHGGAQFPEPEKNFQAHLEIDGLRITDDMLRRLPEKTEKVVRAFGPTGRFGARVALVMRDGVWDYQDDGREPAVTILPDRITAVFEKFRYPVQAVSGTIEFPLITKKVAFHVTGKVDRQPITIRGHSQGSGVDLDFDAELRTSNVSINETLLSALDAEPAKVARSFHATGKVDAVALIRHLPGSEPFEKSIYLTFRDGTALWDSFPLAMSNVSGRLDILPSGQKFHDFTGRHEGGLFSIRGESYAVPGRTKPGIYVEIRGTDIALSPALQRALEPMPSLRKVWAIFAPTGTMNFAAVIHRPTEAIDDLEVRVEAQGASIAPTFFKYYLTDVGGAVHFYKSRLELANFSARHGLTTFVLPHGSVDVKPGGGYHADLKDIDIVDLHADADFLNAMPAALKTAGELMQFRDRLRVQTTHLVVAQAADEGSRPEIYWDAKGWVNDAKFVAGAPIEGVSGNISCRGSHDGHKLLGLVGTVLFEKATVFKQPFERIQSHFKVEGHASDVLLADVHAPLFGGNITGEARIDFQKLATFALNLNASQIDLQKFGQHNLGAQSQIEGKADGKLFLTGSSAGVQSLDGEGKINVVAAKLYKLPLILDLLKFLGLRWPDDTAFVEAHAQARIRGSRVGLRKLELQGNAISLSGQGDFNLDGTDLHVDFYPTWARIEQVLPPALRMVPTAVSKKLIIIEMRGSVTGNADDLKFNKRLAPGLVEPLTNVRDRMMGPAANARRSDAVAQRPAAKPE